jgi:site-specific recombinase XerD
MTKSKISLGVMLQRFFSEWLVNRRNASHNTVKSYNETWVMFLEHLTSTKKCRVYKLSLDDVTADAIVIFLDYLENDRRCSARTQNQRLAAFKSFFKYVVFIDASRLAQCERVFSIPSKIFHREVMGYLTGNEIKAMLDVPDRSKKSGRKVYAMLQFMLNTGARVSEVTTVLVGDITFAKENSQVLIHGKGSKDRIVPIWEDTADLLANLISENGDSCNRRNPVFKNNVKKAMTRSGVRYLLESTVLKAAKSCKSLAEKNVSPHTLRHTTAMELLRHGVDIVLIQKWLGHVNLDTTHQYIENDVDMKRMTMMKGGIVATTPNAAWNPTDEIRDFINGINR